MLCQNFESVPMPYRTRGELNPTVFGQISYNEWIPEPYAETIYADGILISGLFFDPNNFGKLIVTAWMAQVYWPGWNTKRWELDAATGAFIAHGDFIGSWYARDAYQGAGGEIYLLHVTGQLVPLGPNYELLNDQTIFPSSFGFTSFSSVMVDRARDRVVAVFGDNTRLLRVMKLSDGSLVDTYDFLQTIEEICYAEYTTVYILLSDRTIIGLDYATGGIFQATKMPEYPLDFFDAGRTRMAYDRRYRRLLFIRKTPDNPDGSSTTTVKGFLNRPIATYVCEAIPLSRSRVGQKTRMLYKITGDRGEGLMGAVDVVSTDTAASTVQPTIALDTDGEGVGEVLGLSEGVENLSVSAEVACLL